MEVMMMNKEDILLMVEYLKERDLDKDMEKLRDKLNLIKRQIEAQDVIQEVQKELAEMDKVKEK